MRIPQVMYSDREGAAILVPGGHGCAGRRRGSLCEPSTVKDRGDPVTLSEVIDDHFLEKYRGLLDAEDAAFDELEHASEDGDRTPYEEALAQWQAAIERKLAYLQRLGVNFKVSLEV